MPSRYVPSRGDVAWPSFDPQSGHEQAGRRPALIVSPQEYNRKVGLALLCPITNQCKGYPFEVALPKGTKATGVVLADQVKSMDWHARNIEYICRAPDSVVLEVIAKARSLLAIS